MLTFESIRELERAERDAKKLQRLPDNFMAELREYMAMKEKLGADGDVLELHSAKGTVARLLEMRERKIIDGALITARTGLPPESLSPSETELFWIIVERLKAFRNDFFGQIGQAKKSEPAADVARPKLWHIIQAVEFIGPDMKEYKLQVGDKIELPSDVVDILTKQGVVEEVK